MRLMKFEHDKYLKFIVLFSNDEAYFYLNRAISKMNIFISSTIYNEKN
ncbi:hypothetical protein BN165_350010 [Clostridioides difficile E1]|nr:hypothetical protein BN163_360010 [Clostridioides difficile T5]CCK92866.1 hypothetical protein BN164_320010 [Clostridioides difficile T20]CCK96493.1 hypothetical protein BN165_350010 [Clostridioides difficile E1]CCL00521.1 hypothetical protein BN166_410015 [Clostridioides difficile E10]CCL04468.1 hypothetical protein BN167_380012 [Clostridioides difficile E13]CCL05793.1 hypothetical protein BN168_220016 [Clostridioides difficile CD002]